MHICVSAICHWKGRPKEAERIEYLHVGGCENMTGGSEWFRSSHEDRARLPGFCLYALLSTLTPRPGGKRGHLIYGILSKYF